MLNRATTKISASLLALVALLHASPAFADEETTASPAMRPPPPSRQATAGKPAIYNWRRVKSDDGILLADAEFAATSGGSGDRDKVLSWETGAGKSYLIPGLEIPGFLFALNIFDRIAYHDDYTDGKRTYGSNLETTWEHLTEQNWGYDKDPYNVNQLAHPYQGATMYGLARSCGLGFWESWAYANAGSFLWKMAGETDRPSINDMITTGNSGTLLGEALFRMSELVLKEQGPQPDAWHELAAAVISPPNGLNRLAFGNRFKPIFPNHSPATFWRFRLGASSDSQTDGVIDFAMSYGLPGKPGYTYDRPLDYFDFQISGLSDTSNPVGNVLLRGLLYGKRYEAGNDYRGIWGIYGSYDYISPTIFRVSTTALSLGTTAQYWLDRDVALQGSVLGGVGFGAAGVTPTSDGKRDYHYGVTPQGILALRMIFGERAALENVLRGYFVSGTGSDNARGSESIMRNNTNVTVRVLGRHAVSAQVIEAVRDAQYGNLRGRQQTDVAVGFFYTFLGDANFGAVEWRGRE